MGGWRRSGISYDFAIPYLNMRQSLCISDTHVGCIPCTIPLRFVNDRLHLLVISWVAAGKWSETGESFHTEDAAEWIESDIKGEHNFALRVKGDSMEPEFNDGDIIIVSPTAKAVTGDYVVAKNDEEEATFKQYKKFDSARVRHPLNPNIRISS